MKIIFPFVAVCLLFLSVLSAEEDFRLIVIRHGQAWNNVKGIINSNPSHPRYFPLHLTEKGRKQCRKTANELKVLGVCPADVSVCLASPLPRAAQTAQTLAREGLFSEDRIVTEPRIIEIQMGERESCFHKSFPNRQKHDHSNAASYGGETDLEARERMADFLNELKSRDYEDTVVLVSHGTPCNELHYLLTGEKKRFCNAEFQVYWISKQILLGQSDAD